MIDTITGLAGSGGGDDESMAREYAIEATSTLYDGNELSPYIGRIKIAMQNAYEIGSYGLAGAPNAEEWGLFQELNAGSLNYLRVLDAIQEAYLEGRNK